MTNQYLSARWADASQSAVTIETAGKTLTAPAVSGNRHFDALITSGIEIAPFQPAELTQAEYADAVQAHIDATARARGYGDGVALASYVASSIANWRTEAETFINWRDSVWLASFQILGEVQAGTRPIPTISELIQLLPATSWPE